MQAFLRSTLVLLLFASLGRSTVAAEPAATSVKPPAVTLAVETWDGLQRIVAAEKDRVVVVDVWSTFCTPCVRELPHLVKLQAAYPKRVVGISFCIDYTGAKGTEPESLRPNVLAVLRKIGATGTRNLLCSDADETIYDRLELGAVPTVLVYKGGMLVKRFDNDDGDYGEHGFGYERHVTPFVETLLAE